jgi:tRNA A-37 threonylcarbamoyl transferase component Bud32
MNPGPAPRPPGAPGGPRLNLTPNPNVPGNMANMPISPIRSTATSTYTGSTISLPIARQQTNNTDGMGGLAVKKEGWASVKESKNFIQPWKQKYLILRKESLDFHKSADGGKVSYTLYLRDVVNVGRVEAAGTIFEIKRRPDGASNSPGDDDGQTKTLQIKVKSDDDLYEWIDFIYGACPGMGGVSNPTNFSHAVHVGFDPQTGEFVGLPPEWSKLLNSSAITKEDYERNPQAVFEVLDFYTDLAKKAENPSQYPGGMSPVPMPSPSASNQSSKQLGYGSGNSVAPPRATPPPSAQRQPSFGTGSSQSSSSTRQRLPIAEQQMGSQQQQRQQMQGMPNKYVSQDALRDEQRKKQLEAQRQIEDRNLHELAAYNESLPKNKTPIAQQELGGYGNSPSGATYNPGRVAPPAPRPANPPVNGLRAQRPAPPAPSSSGSSARPPMSSQQSSSSIRDQPGGVPRAQRTDIASPSSSAPRYPNGSQSSQTRQPPPQAQQPRLPAPVKPLNVAPKPSQAQQPDGVKAAEAALTAKPSPSERKQDVRMSTMSEADVMAKLKEAVSKEDPNLSYSKQKKIGQGASGSVYVAKIKETATGIAREVLRQQGSRAQVAIKQMDLAHQPRKELIVNEIMVMKDSRHRNIVNFLDAFLRNNYSELWVVMEFMEGGPLTDVIDNNPSISEDQIATICLETCRGLQHLHAQSIIHRDIKSDNVLLDARGNVKISTISILPQLLIFTVKTNMSLQPTLVSAPSSQRRNLSEQPWWAHRTGWPLRLSSKRSTDPRSTSGRWVSWRLR